MANLKIEGLLNDIAQMLREHPLCDSRDTFLYAEGAPGVISSALLFDRGNVVIDVIEPLELAEKLFELWEAAEPDKKWGALFFTLAGSRFDARFQYPDEWVAEEMYMDRLPRVLKARYGDKPIRYD